MEISNLSDAEFKTLVINILKELSEDLNSIKKIQSETSNQDGVIGRYTVPPCTTKRRTTNLKTKNNQKYQKIELYGSLTTNELKKKHSSRPEGGVAEDTQQGGGWRTW